MFVKRFYEPSIAQASYLIGCSVAGEALVIDPNRDADQYIDAAAQEGLRIAHVTETHIHADFVSGTRELAQRTGATMYLSDEGDADWKYACAADGRPLQHGDRIPVGHVTAEAVHTPGHTPEHLTFLITDGTAADRPIAAVTGDFIFVGDVGRPDLLERAAKLAGTMDTSARQLWGSLQRFARREDWLQIWPGHGAGSACGKGISAIPQSTLGYERRFNWAFQEQTEDAFVARVLAGQPDPPTYFAAMKQVNKAGPRILGGLMPPPPIDARALTAALTQGGLVIDTRSAERYAAGHVAGTINIPLNGSFVTWAGWLVPPNTDVSLIVDAGTAARMIDVVRLLALIGVDRLAGWIPEPDLAGIARETVPQMTVEQLAAPGAATDLVVLDVRHAAEWDEGHVPHAVHIPLGHLEARLGELPAGKPIVVHCQLGGRSAIAASVLQRHHRTPVINLVGGYSAWRGAGLPFVRDTEHASATSHS